MKGNENHVLNSEWKEDQVLVIYKMVLYFYEMVTFHKPNLSIYPHDMEIGSK